MLYRHLHPWWKALFRTDPEPAPVWLEALIGVFAESRVFFVKAAILAGMLLAILDPKQPLPGVAGRGVLAGAGIAAAFVFAARMPGLLPDPEEEPAGPGERN
ncbi:MAG: hypothetical protein IT210_06115 [Armatimonadetes bacterium]|nr:hypothetical protein [Armatimonadota bacterium]